MVGGCRGYVVAGLTENKTKPSSWGLAELGNNALYNGHIVALAHALHLHQQIFGDDGTKVKGEEVLRIMQDKMQGKGQIRLDKEHIQGEVRYRKRRERG